MKSLNRLCVVVFTLAAVARGLEAASEESIGLLDNIDQHSKHRDNIDQHSKHRGKRSGNNMSPTQQCNTDWSSWINTHQPTVSDQNDRERITQHDIDSFCPGGQVVKMQCKDEKGEPFTNKNITGPNGDYFITCIDPSFGAECLWYRSNENCPDLSIQFKCSCSHSATDKPNAGTPKSVTNQDSSLNYKVSTQHMRLLPDSQELLSENADTGFKAGRLFVPWWGLYLLIALVLFIVCMCTIVCLHRNLLKQIRDVKQNKTTRVHPI